MIIISCSKIHKTFGVTLLFLFPCVLSHLVMIYQFCSLPVDCRVLVAPINRNNMLLSNPIGSRILPFFIVFIIVCGLLHFIFLFNLPSLVAFASFFSHVFL